MIGADQGPHGLGAYRMVEGIGATPEQFMKMGLDAVRISLLRAEAAIKVGDRPEKAKALGSAGNIIEFMLGLSGAEPGPLSDCLASVYRFALAAILQANAADDTEAVAAARTALDELASTWRSLYPDTLGWDGAVAAPLPAGGGEHA